jgi:phosphinothricin acetyltransferase
MQNMTIRRATTEDASAILDIYNWYVENTIITFETTLIDKEDMENRISNILSKYDWLIAEENGRIIGYAYYGQFRSRAAYNHTVETAIYFSKEYTGKGMGKMLYQRLFELAKSKGYRELIGVISIPNPESISFHQKQGFTEAGIFRNVGYKFNRYLDVCFMQKSLIE